MNLSPEGIMRYFHKIKSIELGPSSKGRIFPG